MIQVHPKLQDVEQASALQRRLYRAMRETMRAMAGCISGVTNWEAKKLLARHIWLDAEHANVLRIERMMWFKPDSPHSWLWLL